MSIATFRAIWLLSISGAIFEPFLKLSIVDILPQAKLSEFKSFIKIVFGYH
jgi:hypothetical protein